MRLAHVHRPHRAHAVRVGAAKHAGRGSRTARPLSPEGFALFSDRLDDAREYESTMRDFALVRDLTRSADDYDS